MMPWAEAPESEARNPGVLSTIIAREAKDEMMSLTSAARSVTSAGLCRQDPNSARNSGIGGREYVCALPPGFTLHLASLTRFTCSTRWLDPHPHQLQSPTLPHTHSHPPTPLTLVHTHSHTLTSVHIHSCTQPSTCHCQLLPFHPLIHTTLTIINTPTDSVKHALPAHPPTFFFFAKAIRAWTPSVRREKRRKSPGLRQKSLSNHAP